MILIGFRQPSIRTLLIEGLLLLAAPVLAGLLLLVSIMTLFFLGMFSGEEEEGPERALPYLLRPLYFLAMEAIDAVRLHLSCHLLSRRIRRASAPGPAHERIL